MIPSASPAHPGLLNWGIIISLGIIWGSAFMSIALSLEGYPLFWTTALRVVLGAGALLILAPLFGQPLSQIGHTPKGWSYCMGLGVLSAALPMTLLSWGIADVPTAFAGVAIGTVPLIILPLAYLFLPEEGIGPRRIIGVGLGFIGLAILMGPSVFDQAPLGAQIACLAAAFCYAAGSIVTRRAPKMPPLAFAAAILLCGGIVLIPIAWVMEGPPKLAAIGPTLALLYLGIMPTGVGAALRVRVITTAGSVFMSQTSYMIPLWSTFFGVLILKESLPMQFYVALVLILLGIIVSQSRRRGY